MICDECLRRRGHAEGCPYADDENYGPKRDWAKEAEHDRKMAELLNRGKDDVVNRVMSDMLRSFGGNLPGGGI